MVELSNCEFHKTYTLQAQTPMIHFQHGQTGAALRPSEVKPKLDRYLRSLRSSIPAHWLIPGQPQALNYQMRIVAAEDSKEKGELSIEDCKAYFGNQGEGPAKGLVFCNCKLEINCFIPDLLAFLDENIGKFFVFHNFGTRQSKGFGGFLVKEKTTEAQAGALIRQCGLQYFYAEFDPNTDIKGRLNHAMVVYACLKNGFSMGSRRFEGYATNGYMLSDVGNDQEFIGDCIIKNLPPNYDSYEFIRAVLGLAEQYDYRAKGLVKVVQYEGTEVKNGRPVIPLESVRDNLGIKRFRSPILIKIFRNRMFFIMTEDYKDILGKVFLLIRERDWAPIKSMLERKQYDQARETLQRVAKAISTPTEFDAVFFMTDFVDYFEEKKSVIGSFPRNWKPSKNLCLEKGGKS